MEGAIANARRKMARWASLAQELHGAGDLAGAQTALKKTDYWRKRSRYYRQELRSSLVGSQRQQALTANLIEAGADLIGA